MHRSHPLLALLGLLALLLLGAPAVGHGQGQGAGSEADALRSAPVAIYLPAIHNQDTFAPTPAIWAHGATPTSPEIVLFRHTFTLSEPLAAAHVQIFADTHYDLWLDGAWVGRGPARFSYQTREYDQYELGTLAPGPHTIAVLGRWSPNVRRSESVAPLLQARVAGADAQGLRRVAAQTGASWQALLATAWRRDASLVHAWGLIGPTELLDLRQLPAGWTQPTFGERWPAAVVRSTPPARYGPRSIPPLARVPMPVTVREVGLLALNRTVAELAAPASPAYDLPLTVLAPTTLVLQSLQVPDGALPTARLDGVPLEWQSVTGQHPDLRSASQGVLAGQHTLSLRDIPASGFTFTLARHNLQPVALPFQQGNHAGRRLLLAQPTNQPGAVTVTPGEALTLQVNQAPAYVVLDLGRVVHGRLVVEASGPAGTIVDMGWDERLWGGRPLPYPGSFHKEWNQSDSWVLDGTPRTLTTLDSRAGRYILLAVWGNAAVRLTNLRVEEERLPVTLRGRFASGDARLDQIWQVGVDTLYPNMTDGYTDTPWRERGQWWGDAFVSQHVNQVSVGDVALLRRGLRLMADGSQAGRLPSLAPNGADTNMVDFGMLWVQSLHDYGRLSGDQQTLDRLYPTLVAFMDGLALRQGTTGLLEVPTGHWSQTALVDWAGGASRAGQSTALNAMYYGTLLDAAELAAVRGDAPHATQWRQRAENVRLAAQTYLYLPAEGAYLTSRLPTGNLPPTAHAQAWALAYGLVPAEAQAQVADSLLALLPHDATSPPTVELYGMFWVLEALGRAGRLADALAIIEQSYGSMLDRGATTWWETFDSDRSYTSSLSHAWGGSPTWFLSRYILGARLLDRQRWQVSPALSGLSAVSGSLPLPTGELAVAWDYAACPRITLALSVPAASSGEILVPYYTPDMVLVLNGATLWQGGQPLAPNVRAAPDGVAVTVGEGQHALAIEGATCGN